MSPAFYGAMSKIATPGKQDLSKSLPLLYSHPPPPHHGNGNILTGALYGNSILSFLNYYALFPNLSININFLNEN
jgi:hypothetical protein